MALAAGSGLGLSPRLSIIFTSTFFQLRLCGRTPSDCRDHFKEGDA